MPPAPLGLDIMVQEWPRCHLDYTYWWHHAGVWFSDLTSHYRRFPSERTFFLRHRGPSFNVSPLGLTPGGHQLIDSSLLTEVIETMLTAWAIHPSMRKLYALEWRIFWLWCKQCHQDPVYCSIGTVLKFLQEHLSEELVPSTLKVAATASSHAPWGIHWELSFGLSLLAWCQMTEVFL